MDDAMSLQHVLLEKDLPGGDTGARVDFSQ
jgi:hypothetical protein